MAYIGPAGEVVYNLDTKRLHMQDGVTPGGIPALKEDGALLWGLAGPVGRASQEEVLEGTNDTRFVTPATLNSVMGWRALQRIHLSVDTAAIYQSIPDDVSQLRISGDVNATGANLTLRISYDGGATFHVSYIEAWMGHAATAFAAQSNIVTNVINLSGASDSVDLNCRFSAIISVGSASKVPSVQAQELGYTNATGAMNFMRSTYSTQLGRITGIMFTTSSGPIRAGTAISIEGC